MCNPPSRDRYINKCSQQAIMDMNAVDSVQYQQWTKTDRSTLKTIVQIVGEILE